MPEAVSRAPAGEPNAARVVASAVRLHWRRTRDELAKVAEDGDGASVHDLRVALRRLLAALEIAEALDAHAGRKIVRRLERLLAALSPLRDLEVEAETLGGMTAREPLLAEVVSELEDRRTTLAKNLSRKLGRVEPDELEIGLEKAVKTLELGAGAPQAVRLLALAAVARCYSKFDRRRRAIARADRHALHRVRVAFKRYRYAVEITLPLLPPSADRGLVRMKHFQDELGAIQDATVLIATLARLAPFRRRKGSEHGRTLVAALERNLRERIRSMLGTLAAQVAVDPPVFSDLFG
jgi:CHAD domain-containing protein